MLTSVQARKLSAQAMHQLIHCSDVSDRKGAGETRQQLRALAVRAEYTELLQQQMQRLLYEMMEED